jgi:DUF1365 family protein
VRSASCIYEGTIRHRRLEPRRSFQHRIALFYLDLEELPSLMGGRLMRTRPGLLRFRRADYLGHDGSPLDVAVRDAVRAGIGRRPEGPIRLLTQLRTFGPTFNPVSFYYCLDPARQRVDAIVAEVTNTPWGERHAYVVDGKSGEMAKALHVSPFMGMNQRYLMRAGMPGERLSVHIESRHADSVSFDATLALRRVELTQRSVARVAWRYPLAGARTLALIYGRALGLKLAGARVYPHPGPHHVTQGESR